MSHTAAVLDALRARLNLPSDYALAPVLGVSRSQMSAWRNGKSPMSDRIAEQIGELLGRSPAYVLACVEADRSKSPKIRAAWAEAAEALCIMLSLALLKKPRPQPF
jgi:transcriptional regulator with XRE-family HTH domain